MRGTRFALFHLVTRNRRRWGGYTVHVGIVLIFMAFAGAAYNVDVRHHVNPGDVVEVTSPSGTPTRSRTKGCRRASIGGRRNLLWQAIATVSVERNGVPKGILTTEKRQYTTNVGQPPMTEVGIRMTPYEDLYLILTALDDTNAALNAESASQGLDLQVLIKPLVAWIWLGTLVLIFGTVVALWPNVDRRRRAETSPVAAEPEAAGAAELIP